MDKVKRSVIFQPLSRGGLNFPNFRTQVMIKSLRLSWLKVDYYIAQMRLRPGRQFRMNILINREG